MMYLFEFFKEQEEDVGSLSLIPPANHMIAPVSKFYFAFHKLFEPIIPVSCVFKSFETCNGNELTTQNLFNWVLHQHNKTKKQTSRMMEHGHSNILSIAGYIDVLYVWSFWSWLKGQMPREMGFECSWSGQGRISLNIDLLEM